MKFIRTWVNQIIPHEFDLNSFALCQLIAAGALWCFATRLEFLREELFPLDELQVILLFLAWLFVLAGYNFANFEPRKPWPKGKEFHNLLRITRNLTCRIFLLIPIMTMFSLVNGTGLARFSLTLIGLCVLLGWLSGFQEKDNKVISNADSIKQDES